MTIWILALVLIASLAGIGYRQGAIRVGFSFLGILFGALLAGPLSGIIHPLLVKLGMKTPGLAWALAPIIGFAIVSALFKVGGLMVHRKVEWKFKYRASDTGLALWTRLNTRLGACCGGLNAVGYLILISFYIYNLSYWTIQVSAPDSESRLIGLVNRMGHDLESTGMAKAAYAVGKLPADFYRFADLAGVLRQNPGASSRLLDYPGLTSFFQRDDVQALGQDTTFTGAWQQQAPLHDLLNDDQVQALLKNDDFLNQATAAVDADYDDLMTYLKTGKSAKYGSEKILGTWDFNLGTTMVYFRAAHPKLHPADFGQIQDTWSQAFAQTKLIFAGDNKVYLKQMPDFTSNTPAAVNAVGDWSGPGDDYKVTLSLKGDTKNLVVSTTDGLRLTVKGLDDALVFDHE